MDDRIRYVYKIFDKLNENKFYIGTTFDIEQRWKQHQKNSNSNKLNADMLELGTQNFNIETLFNGTEDEAYAEEMRLIVELKPYYNNKGDIGGKWGEDTKGENHWKAKLKEQDILDICNRVVVKGERVIDVAKDYSQVSENIIGKIVNGDHWNHVAEAPRRKAEDNKGENNGKSKLVRQDILDICDRVVVNGESVVNVAKDYPQVSESIIGKIVNGDHWDHVAEAPRKKANKIFTKEEVLDIRTLAFEGKTAEYIQENIYPNKIVITIERVITGETFYKYEGPQKGRDY